MSVFNINGNNIVDNPITNNFLIDAGYYDGAQYYMLRIFKKKVDGSEQCPFAVAPNGTEITDYSALDLALLNDDYYIVINAGLGRQTEGFRHYAMGNLIVNANVLLDEPLPYRPLAIDGNGNLSAPDPATTAAELVANGCVSCVLGFGSIIENYVPIAEEDFPAHKWGEISQRQIIGQYANGDYAIVTCEGRDYDNSTGWNVPKMQAFCLLNNMKFAYCLDGGGSTELVIGKKQVNIIYERETGRRICSLLVFNGGNQYIAPNLQ